MEEDLCRKLLTLVGDSDAERVCLEMIANEALPKLASRAGSSCAGLGNKKGGSIVSAHIAKLKRFEERYFHHTPKNNGVASLEDLQSLIRNWEAVAQQ